MGHFEEGSRSYSTALFAVTMLVVFGLFPVVEGRPITWDFAARAFGAAMGAAAVWWLVYPAVISLDRRLKERRRARQSGKSEKA